MIEEIEKAVHNIEQDIYDSTGGVEYLNITIKSNGFVQVVKFIGIELWNSESDMREDINEYGDKEDIEVHLRQVLREELNKLSSIVV